MPRVRMSWPERFWTKVDKSGDCWLWTRGVNGKGYGQFQTNMRKALAHRLSLQMAIGRELEPSEMACHRCNNRRCVRPDHLYVGDAKSNVADAIRAGTFSFTNQASRARSMTHCQRGHEFSPANTHWDKRGRRTCRECKRATDRRKYYRNRAKVAA